LPSKYTALLFDLDGTVADTDEMIVQTMNILYDLYRNGRRTPREEIYYFSGPPIYDTLNKEFPGCDMEFMHSEFRRVSVELYPKTVTTYPGAKETLLKLKEQGYKLGVVTNKIHSSTLLCLKLIGLEGIFDSLVCFDDVKNPKPQGEPIEKAMKELNVLDLSKVLYIGDNKIDLDTANNAHVDCALVSWGPRVLDKNLKPTFTIASFEELERKLR
jgi:pyrophosphatase PpaX